VSQFDRRMLPNMRISYDPEADAAYIYLTEEPLAPGQELRLYRRSWMSISNPRATVSNRITFSLLERRSQAATDNTIAPNSTMGQNSDVRTAVRERRSGGFRNKRKTARRTSALMATYRTITRASMLIDNTLAGCSPKMAEEH
jgi:hypothetical protein